MKTYSERTQDILAKAATEKRRRRRVTAAITSVSCLVLVVCASLIFFRPQGDQPGDLGQYSGSDYYPIIAKLESFQKDNLNGNGNWDSLVNGPGLDLDVGLPEAAPPVADSRPDGSVEITDLQVAGVGEADRIKRTGKHIFYLRNDGLYAYSIEGLQSQQVGCYQFDEASHIYSYRVEFFLSPDGTTVTIMIPHRNTEISRDVRTLVLNLDVTDPANITETGRMYLSGNYQSSRYIDGELYVFTRYQPTNMDFSEPTTFIPSYGPPEDPTCIPAESIYAPGTVSNCSYTVVSKLDAKTLEMLDTAACLSYSSTVYVSQDSIFLTHGYQERTDLGSKILYCQKTDITRLDYSGEKLVNKGSTTVNGSILNQYSMDQKDNILRVVTTTDSDLYRENSDGLFPSMTHLESKLNASLYCIDLEDWSIAASVTNFAPEGESVRSVRFDGDNAYVCTAVQLRDPVFFFDLSDLNNITYKDTGTISGFSMSLVDFAPGYLLGIGVGDSFSTLKVEVYQEGNSAVESLCDYQKNDIYFSSEYKSYLIDRENKFVGLAIDNYATGTTGYLLLYFNGQGLIERCCVEMDGDVAAMRGVYIDGYLYVLGDDFAVKSI